VVIAALGLALWHRDRRLWVLGAVGAGSALITAGWGESSLNATPILQDIVAQRYVAPTVFCVAAMLGLTVDHVHAFAARWATSRSTPSERPGEREPITSAGRWSGAVAALLISTLALLPPLVYLSQTLPMTAVSVAVPDWFREVGPGMSGHNVVLVLPSPYSKESPMAWQATDEMSYDIVGGAGPGESGARIGKELPAYLVLDTYTKGPMTSIQATTTQQITQVRNGLDGWGVTTVVVPDQPQLPEYDQIPSVTAATALMTAVTGRKPEYKSHAWVWQNIDRSPRPATISGSQLRACTASLATRGNEAVQSATACVLRQLDTG
jgi:hypothetical protein